MTVRNGSFVWRLRPSSRHDPKRLVNIKRQMWKKWHVAKVVLAVGLAVWSIQKVDTAPATEGQWTTLPYLMPINLNPIHLALMNNGKVLMVAGSGNDETNLDFELGV